MALSAAAWASARAILLGWSRLATKRLANSLSGVHTAVILTVLWSGSRLTSSNDTPLSCTSARVGRGVVEFDIS